MHRRNFLYAIGAGLSLPLLPFSSTIDPDGPREAVDPPAPREGGDPSARRDHPPRQGLRRCRACGEWKGVVIARDGSPKEAVCLCEPSRCGRCGEVVHPRRICGHYWSEERQALVHVPSFVGMRHRCLAR